MCFNGPSFRFKVGIMIDSIIDEQNEIIDTARLTKSFFDISKEFFRKYNLEVISNEVKVFGTLCYDLKFTGRMDFLLKQCKKYYCCELELAKERKEFWASFKVIGYKNALLLDRGLKQSQVGCLVILHQNIYHPNMRNIFACADIDFMFINDYFDVFKSSLEIGKCYCR
jgi:hypothetical protein